MVHAPRRILTTVSILILTLSVLGVVGSGQTRSPTNSASLSPSHGQRLFRLDVEIKTRDERDATIGSFQLIPGSNHVWLDLGFKAWDLSSLPTVSENRPFNKKGGVDRWENLPLPEQETITTDDIFELRFEKKGLAGFTHAIDGFGGGWKPESVTLFVNGEPFGETLSVLPSGQKLSIDRPAWRHLFKAASAEERFILGLRVEPIPVESNWLGQLIAGITTEFKKLRVSGWQNGPLEQYRADDQFTSDGDAKNDPLIEHVSAEGVLYKPPRSGTDGYVTLDLRLQTVTIFNANGTKTEYAVNTEGGIPHRRYIRVEYKWRKKGQPNDRRYRTEKWSVGDHFYAEGSIRWDTDWNGFYEIHPDFSEAFLRRLKSPSPK